MPEPRIRHATKKDVGRILCLYETARAFMHRTGNPTQWPSNYPGKDDVIDDLRKRRLYVCQTDEGVQAVFFFAPGPDATYAHIDGAWLNDEPYWVVHRIAAAPGSGAGRRSLTWARDRVRNLRIDTHEDNAPMRHVLQRLGFVACGTIICEDGTPRLAFQHAAGHVAP